MHYEDLDPEMANTREYIMLRRALDARRAADDAVPDAPPSAAVSQPARDAKASPGADTTDISTADDASDRTRNPRAGITLYVLGSGSKGNAAIVATPDDALLIDCGLGKADFLSRCAAVGFDPQRISSILVTHEHSDHVKGLGVVTRGLAKMGVHPTLYVTRASHDASTALCSLDETLEVREIVPEEEYTISGLACQVFATSHDAAASVGFGFAYGAHASDTLGYVTDTGCLSPLAREVLADRRILAIESNHDAHMLDIGPYPSFLKRRIAGDHGHLGNGQAADELEGLLTDTLEQVVAMHLSETNNLPDLPLDTLGAAVARNQHPAHVQVAAQYKPIVVW